MQMFVSTGLSIWAQLILHMSYKSWAWRNEILHVLKCWTATSATQNQQILSLFQIDCTVLNEINIVTCIVSKSYELCCTKNFKYLQSIFFKRHIDVLLSSHYLNQYNFELTWSGYILESLSLWFRLRTLDNFAKGVSFDKHVLYLLCRNV